MFKITSSNDYTLIVVQLTVLINLWCFCCFAFLFDLWDHRKAGTMGSKNWDHILFKLSYEIRGRDRSGRNGMLEIELGGFAKRLNDMVDYLLT